MLLQNSILVRKPSTMLDIENSFRPGAKNQSCHYQLKISGLAHDLYSLKEKTAIESHVGECRECAAIYEKELKHIKQMRNFLERALHKRTNFSLIENEIKETTTQIFNGESLAIDDEGVVDVELPSLFNQSLRWIRQTINSL